MHLAGKFLNTAGCFCRCCFQIEKIKYKNVISREFHNKRHWIRKETGAYDRCGWSPAGRPRRREARLVAESCSVHCTSRAPEMCCHESPLYIEGQITRGWLIISARFTIYYNDCCCCSWAAQLIISCLITANGLRPSNQFSSPKVAVFLSNDWVFTKPTVNIRIVYCHATLESRIPWRMSN